MVLIKISDLKEGMILAKDIYHIHDKVLLSEGTIIHQSFIRKLQAQGVSEVYVEDRRIGKINVDDLVCRDVRERTAVFVEKAFQEAADGLSIHFPDIQKIVAEIVTEILNKEDVLIQLVNIHSIDDYTLNHSINVCIYSLITAVTLGYDRETLLELGIGAILHDVGKVMLPDVLLNKNDRLSEEEYEQVKEHTIKGYEILEKIEGLSQRAKNIALMHHERMDGRGYPQGLKGDEIDEFAKIVSVVDVFDALTSDRIYREKIEAHLALEYLISMSKIQFDYEVVRNFVQNVAIYPIGAGVKLSNEEIGVVIGINREFPTRPLVRVVKDAGGKTLKEPKDYNLMENLSLFISRRADVF